MFDILKQSRHYFRTVFYPDFFFRGDEIDLRVGQIHTMRHKNRRFLEDATLPCHPTG
jgi:hypothetical protein